MLTTFGTMMRTGMLAHIIWCLGLIAVELAEKAPSITMATVTLPSDTMGSALGKVAKGEATLTNLQLSKETTASGGTADNDEVTPSWTWGMESGISGMAQENTVADGLEAASAAQTKILPTVLTPSGNNLQHAHRTAGDSSASPTANTNYANSLSMIMLSSEEVTVSVRTITDEQTHVKTTLEGHELAVGIMIGIITVIMVLALFTFLLCRRRNAFEFKN